MSLRRARGPIAPFRAPDLGQLLVISGDFGVIFAVSGDFCLPTRAPLPTMSCWPPAGHRPLEINLFRDLNLGAEPRHTWPARYDAVRFSHFRPERNPVWWETTENHHFLLFLTPGQWLRTLFPGPPLENLIPDFPRIPMVAGSNRTLILE